MASYLQTLCLVENVRTSFDDLLSLASMYNGDIRRALLSLQVRLQTGSTPSQKMAAPVLGPIVTVVLAATNSCCKSITLTGDAVKSSGKAELDSGDEFVVARPTRKRRALRVASSDEDSQPLAGLTATVADDTSSHQGCMESSSSANAGEQPANGVTDPLPVAMDTQLAPPVVRLDFAAVGGVESLPHYKLWVS